MGFIGIVKKFLNSQIGTGYAVPLDNFLGGKVICKGFVGTRFVIKSTQEQLKGFFEYVVEIKNESMLDNAEENIRKELVYLPIGTYEATINVPGIGEVKSTFDVGSLNTIVIKYSAKKTIKLFTEPGSHTFRYNDYVDSPESGEFSVKVNAVGGAGGGSAGESGKRGSSGNGGNGGNGGNFGNYGKTLKSKIIKIDPNKSYSLTIGKGGDGGSYSGAEGKPGEATVFDNIFTLSGGSVNYERGEVGETAVGTKGGNGGNGSTGSFGGKGGLGGSTPGNNSNNGTDGKKGDDGSTNVENVFSFPGSGGGGGGGGDRYGSGGNGGAGGKGGDGFIEIFKGIVVS